MKQEELNKIIEGITEYYEDNGWDEDFSKDLSNICIAYTEYSEDNYIELSVSLDLLKQNYKIVLLINKDGEGSSCVELQHLEHVSVQQLINDWSSHMDLDEWMSWGEHIARERAIDLLTIKD